MASLLAPCRLYNKLQDLDSLQQENGFFLQFND